MPHVPQKRAPEAKRAPEERHPERNAIPTRFSPTAQHNSLKREFGFEPFVFATHFSGFGIGFLCPTALCVFWLSFELYARQHFISLAIVKANAREQRSKAAKERQLKNSKLLREQLI